MVGGTLAWQVSRCKEYNTAALQHHCRPYHSFVKILTAHILAPGLKYKTSFYVLNRNPLNLPAALLDEIYNLLIPHPARIYCLDGDCVPIESKR